MGFGRNCILGNCHRMSTRYSEKKCLEAEINICDCFPGLSSIPYGFASRFIIFLGALTAYLLYTGFAAGITSLVAVQNQNYEITVTDIEKMKLNVVSFGNLVHLPVKYDYLVRNCIRRYTYL